MLKAIVQREILEYLQSSRFLIGLSLTLVLVGMSTFVSIVDYASESVADVGPRREARFLKDARAYADIYDSYILEKLGQLVGTSHWSFGTGLTLNDKYVNISSPQPKEYRGDKSDFPQFVESKPNLAMNAQEAFLDLGGLALWNLILAMLAFWGISRCDVR